jgi:hypothetical protein
MFPAEQLHLGNIELEDRGSCSHSNMAHTNHVKMNGLLLFVRSLGTHGKLEACHRHQARIMHSRKPWCIPVRKDL